MSSEELLHTIRLLQQQLSGMEKILGSEAGETPEQAPPAIGSLLAIVGQLQSFIVSSKLDQAALEERDKSLQTSTEAAYTRQLSALHTATSMLLSTLDLETLLGQIIDAATNAIPAAEKGILYLVARDTGNLEIRATMGYTDPRIKKLTVPGTKGYVPQAIQECKPLLIHDTLAPFPPAELNEARSAIITPLLLENRAQGALALHASAFLQSIMGASVRSRRVFIISAVIAIIIAPWFVQGLGRHCPARRQSREALRLVVVRGRGRFWLKVCRGSARYYLHPRPVSARYAGSPRRSGCV